jgi:hypothetical protein
MIVKMTVANKSSIIEKPFARWICLFMFAFETDFLPLHRSIEADWKHWLRRIRLPAT